MIWQFTGVGPHNKGAELMFLAMREKVIEMDPDACIAMRPGPEYEWRARQGLWQVWDRGQGGRFGWAREKLLHRGYRERFGMVHQNDVNVVLDASGFSLGDAWKPEWIEGMAKYYERLRKRGITIVLLPQAFGPFQMPRVRAAARRVLSCADLVFARDSESLQHVLELELQNVDVRQAPDFTNLLKGYVPEDWDCGEDRVAIVPNRQMLVHNSSEIAEAYLPALVSAIRRIKYAGLRPFVLLHEQGDRKIAQTLCREASLDKDVVEYSDPLALKGILGNCAFTIGSRYHGLINSLSQTVPSLGTSWSHKYRHLFADYAAEDCLLEVTGDSIATGLQPFLDSDVRNTFRARLAGAGTKLREQAQAMWNMVTRAVDQ